MSYTSLIFRYAFIAGIIIVAAWTIYRAAKDKRIRDAEEAEREARIINAVLDAGVRTKALNDATGRLNQEAK